MVDLLLTKSFKEDDMEGIKFREILLEIPIVPFSVEKS